MQSKSHSARLEWVLILVAVTWVINAEAGSKLDRIERELEEDSRIEQIEVEQIAQWMTSDTVKLHLFDVRTEEEYAISHLPGAIRLDPDADPKLFVSQNRAMLENDKVVFYCSVGRRATALAEAVDEVLEAEGIAQHPANMKGGVFRWHNESRPLENAEGSTDMVHSFSWFWQFILDRREKSVN